MDSDNRRSRPLSYTVKMTIHVELRKEFPEMEELDAAGKRWVIENHYIEGRLRRVFAIRELDKITILRFFVYRVEPKIKLT